MAHFSRLLLCLHYQGEAAEGQDDLCLVADHRRRQVGCAYAAAMWLFERAQLTRQTGGDDNDGGCSSNGGGELGGEMTPDEVLGSIGCTAFVVSLLVEQDARALTLEQKLLQELGQKAEPNVEEEGWQGDEEGPERHAEALLDLALRLAQGD